MIKEYARKYAIIMEVLGENKEKILSINEIYMLAETKGAKFNINFTDKDVSNILSALYDEFIIDKVIKDNNVICFKVAQKYQIQKMLCKK